MAAYRRLVYETPGFRTFFRQMTPIAEIATLKIGSRPASRTGELLEKTRISLAVLLKGYLAGIAGAILAEELPYAILLQGQPYRTVWLLAFLHVALVCWLCIEWSRHASLGMRLASCVLLAYLCIQLCVIWEAFRLTRLLRDARLRAFAAGVMETAGTTFLLLIAVRAFAAGALAKIGRAHV